MLHLPVYIKDEGKKTHRNCYFIVYVLKSFVALSVFCTGGNWSKWVLGVVKVADPWYSPATPPSLRLTHSLHSPSTPPPGSSQSLAGP